MGASSSANREAACGSPRGAPSWPRPSSPCPWTPPASVASSASRWTPPSRPTASCMSTTRPPPPPLTTGSAASRPRGTWSCRAARRSSSIWTTWAPPPTTTAGPCISAPMGSSTPARGRTRTPPMPRASPTSWGRSSGSTPMAACRRTTPSWPRLPARTASSGPWVCGTPSPSPSSRARGASSSTTWARTPGRRWMRGLQAPTTGGRPPRGPRRTLPTRAPSMPTRTAAGP